MGMHIICTKTVDQLSVVGRINPCQAKTGAVVQRDMKGQARLRCSIAVVGCDDDFQIPPNVCSSTIEGKAAPAM